jgi:hypothetical protein
MGFAAPEGLKGLRDRALLLLGFAGVFRRAGLIRQSASAGATAPRFHPHNATCSWLRIERVKTPSGPLMLEVKTRPPTEVALANSLDELMVKHRARC